MAFHAIPDEGTVTFDQACAVPFRVDVERIEYCLITSTAGRWIFPKGFVERGETLEQAALKEAFEEAGIQGHVVGEPIGYYEIEKKGRRKSVIAVLMEVSHMEQEWHEASFRQRRWVSRREAQRLISEPYLFELLEAAHARVRAA